MKQKIRSQKEETENKNHQTVSRTHEHHILLINYQEEDKFVHLTIQFLLGWTEYSHLKTNSTYTKPQTYTFSDSSACKKSKRE